MRLFIASPVTLDDYASIKTDFEGVIEGRWVEEEKLHLTWVFLSEHPTLKETVEKMAPLSNLEEEVEIASLGTFGTPPRIFFAKSEQTLLYDKAREFKSAGFDLYRFKPHITLCRVEKILDYKAYKEKVKAYNEKPLGKILPQIILYESKRTSRGLDYQVRHEVQEA
jgi:2'-5' RNA ligase